MSVSPGVARSWLLVSAALPDLLERVATVTADVVVVDLEDGVPATGKVDARAALRSLLLDWPAARPAPWVRISPAGVADWDADLAAIRATPRRPGGVMLAKADSVSDVRRTRKALDSDVPLVVMIESAAGLERAAEIAAEPGVLRLVFGSGDFRRDLSVPVGSPLVNHARCRIVVASRAAGLFGPVDGPTVGSDPEVLERESEAAAALGMTGRLCLRAEQAVAIDRAMSPSPAELVWAEAILRNSSAVDASAAPRIAQAQAIQGRGAVFGIAAPPAAGSYSGNG